jgi:hypothetical protein
MLLHVLNRARWSGLQMSRQLLVLLVTTWVPAGRVTIAVDEILERRWGPQIRKRGHWRDSLASSRQLNVSSSGLRWLVFALVVNMPWTPYALALPFLSVLLTTPKVSAQLGRPHKTVAHITGQVVLWLRRALPGQAIHLVGDGAYAVIAPGLRRQRQQVTSARGYGWMSGCANRRNAWSANAGAGRRSWGRACPLLSRSPANRPVASQSRAVVWRHAHHCGSDHRHGPVYITDTPPPAIRWVLVRYPHSDRPIRAVFSTESAQGSPRIII